MTAYNAALDALQAARERFGHDSREAGLARNQALVLLMQFSGQAFVRESRHFQIASHGWLHTRRKGARA